jgi:hypothetical protein
MGFAGRVSRKEMKLNCPDKKNWILRTETSLYARIKALAKKEKRSVNQTCELLLAFALDSCDQAPAYHGYLSGSRGRTAGSSKVTHGKSLKVNQLSKAAPSRKNQPYIQGSTR